ncbi:MAG: RDD family protein [Candidatus Acidiferrales bacterium]
MFCSKCGAQVADTAAFCPSCGQGMSGGSTAPRGIPLAPGGGFSPQAEAGAPPPPAAPVMAAPAYPAYPSAMPRHAVAYGGFWLRFVAYIIDALILAVPLGFLFVAFFASSGILNSFNSSSPFSPDSFAHLMGMRIILRFVLLAFVAEWLYYALLESSPWQATVGKKALGIYVTDLSGGRISFGRATGRYFSMIVFRLVPILGAFLFWPIDCICAGFTDKKQALHDMMAGCLVIRKI